MATNKYLEQLDEWPLAQPVPAAAYTLLTVPSLRKDFRLPASALAADGKVGNAARSTYKCVVDIRRKAHNVGYDVRDELDPDSFCLGALCRSEAADAEEDKVSVCVFDPEAAPSAAKTWLDGSFQGVKRRFKWVPATSLEAAAGGIVDFDPNRLEGYLGPDADGRGATLIRQNQGEVSYFYSPKFDLKLADYPAGFPDPAEDDGNVYRRAAPPTPPTVLYQRTTAELLLQARQLSTLVTGRQYELERGELGDILVEAIGGSGNMLSPLALWRNPDTLQLEQVLYNLDTDTVTPNPAGAGGSAILLFPAEVPEEGVSVTAGEAYATAAGGLHKAKQTFTARAQPGPGAYWQRLLPDQRTDAQIVAAVTASGLFAGINDPRFLTTPPTASLLPAGGIGPPTRYATAQAAHDAAGNGDTLSLVGPQTSLIVTKNITVCGGYFTQDVGVGNFQDRSQPPVTATFLNIGIGARFVVIHHNGPVGHAVKVQNPALTSSSYFEQYNLGSGTTPTGQDTTTVTGVRTVNSAAYVAASGAASGRGLLRFQERNDNPHSSRWTFADCGELGSISNGIFTGYASADTRIVLAGTTALTPGPRGITDIYRTIGQNRIADADIIIDQRPVGGGGGGSYTDEQAQDAAAALLTAGTHSGISFAYDDAAGKLNATVTAGPGGPGPGSTIRVRATGAVGSEAYVDVPDNAFTQLSIWPNVQRGAGQGFNPGTGVFTAPAAGIVDLGAGIEFYAGTSSAASIFALIVYVNSQRYLTLGIVGCPVAGSPYGLSARQEVDVQAGDTVEVRLYHNAGAGSRLLVSTVKAFITISS